MSLAPSNNIGRGAKATTNAGVATFVSTKRSNQSQECSILEMYHLEGRHNYAIWSYRMKYMLQHDGLYAYCITPPSASMNETKSQGRESTFNPLNNNAKNAVLWLLKKYGEPYRCWTKLKERYEPFNNPRRIMLIEEFISMRKPKLWT